MVALSYNPGLTGGEDLITSLSDSHGHDWTQIKTRCQHLIVKIHVDEIIVISGRVRVAARRSKLRDGDGYLECHLGA